MLVLRPNSFTVVHLAVAVQPIFINIYFLLLFLSCMFFLKESLGTFKLNLEITSRTLKIVSFGETFCGKTNCHFSKVFKRVNRVEF